MNKLDYIYIEGIVSHGNKIGNKIGFPTANLDISNIDKNIVLGVYVVKVNIDNVDYFGVANIGTKPTVTSEKKVVLEVNIFNFNQDIYNKKIGVELVKFLRSEVKFHSLDELKQQIKEDKKNAKDYLLTIR